METNVRFRTPLARLLAGYAFIPTAALPATAQAGPPAAMDDDWHFVMVPYFWFAGIDGTVTVKGIVEVPVEKSFSDVISDFDIGLLGHLEGRKSRVGFAFDLMYLNLGAPVAAEDPVLGALAPVRALGTGRGLAPLRHRLRQGRGQRPQGVWRGVRRPADLGRLLLVGQAARTQKETHS
jgi:hypothetical protein